MAPLGKKELLAWAAEATGICPCAKYGDLRDGVVLLALAARLFPKSVDPRALRRGPVNVEQNWDTLRRVMRRHGLPLHLCDYNAVPAGHARHCFNMLVLFYFLTRLASDSDFSVDFANPIDPCIAEFLQSPRSLLSVGKLPATEAGEGREEREVEKRERATGLVQPPPPPLPLPSSQSSLSRSSSIDVPPVVASSCASSSFLPCAAALASSSQTGGGVEGRTKGDYGKDNAPGLKSLQARNVRLEEELNHVRATSQLMLAQQRALLAGEVARMTEQFEVQMALLRLERDHEVRRCLIDVREEYNNLLDGEGGKTAPASSPALSFTALKALEGKVHTYECELAEARDTIQELRNAINVQRDRHEAFAERICSICTPVSVNGPDEKDFVKAVLPVLETQPQAVRGAVLLQLKTLLAQTKAVHDRTNPSCGGVSGEGATGVGDQGEVLFLRMQLEKLKRENSFLRHQRCQQQQQKQHHDWHAVPLADGLEAPSCMVDFETCDTICARANAVVEAHTSAASPARQELQRLVLVVQILQARVQTAADALITYQGKQQALYEQLLSVQQNGRLDAQEQQRALEAKLEEQRLQMKTSEAAFSTKMRLLEERTSRQEAVAKMLHERVRDMVGSLLKQTTVHGDGGGVAPEEVWSALQRIMAGVVGPQRTRDSIDTSGCELADEVATLRENLARKDQEVERLRTTLAAVEAAHQEEKAKLAKTTVEVNRLRDSMAVEVDACRRYMKRVGELLMMEVPPSPSLPGLSVTSTALTTAGTDSSLAAMTSLVESDNTKNGRNHNMCGVEKTGCVTTAAASASSFSKAPAAGIARQVASSLLSPEELERRKVEILEKYGFLNRLDH